MNSDEIKSLLVKVLMMVLTALATQLHANLGATSILAIATDSADLLVLAYGIYSHWNMKKVPEAAVVAVK
jgi:hypothetical protein